MGKKKTKRAIKREERERLAEEQEAATAVFEAKRRKYRLAAMIVPVVALVAAIAVYVITDDKQLAGLVGMFGVGIFVPLLLGAVGGQVTPRDRTRAGSIDFGNKR